jgi:hypothetical protein
VVNTGYSSSKIVKVNFYINSPFEVKRAIPTDVHVTHPTVVDPARLGRRTSCEEYE